MRTKHEIFKGIDETEFFIRCKLSFEFFVRNVIGADIEGYQVDWVTFIELHKRTAIIAATGFGKTVTVGIWYPLWKMFCTPSWQCLVVSNSMTQGSKILESVVDIINDNEVLQDLKGNTDTWKATQINTRNRCKMFCLPNTENVKGVHVNYVLADEASSYKDQDCFFRFVETRANAKQGNLCAISTLTSPDDLMNKLRNNPAYKTIMTGCYKLNGMATSKRFPLDYLEGIKLRIGKDAFRKEYECDVSVVLDAIFPPNLIISCFDNNIGFSLDKKDYEGMVYIGCDFAYSEHGDYSVFTVLDVTDSKIVIRHIERYRGMSITEQTRRLIALNQILSPVSFLVDESNIGQNILQDLRVEGLPVQGQNFAPINRHNILVLLKTKMESGKIIIPHREDGITEKVVDELKRELSSFKRKRTPSGLETFQADSKHDDLVISLSLSIKASEQCQAFVDYMATEYKELSELDKQRVGGDLIVSS